MVAQSKRRQRPSFGRIAAEKIRILVRAAVDVRAPIGQGDLGSILFGVPMLAAIITHAVLLTQGPKFLGRRIEEPPTKRGQVLGESSFRRVGCADFDAQSQRAMVERIQLRPKAVSNTRIGVIRGEPIRRGRPIRRENRQTDPPLVHEDQAANATPTRQQ